MFYLTQRIQTYASHAYLISQKKSVTDGTTWRVNTVFKWCGCRPKHYFGTFVTFLSNLNGILITLLSISTKEQHASLFLAAHRLFVHLQYEYSCKTGKRNLICKSSAVYTWLSKSSWRLMLHTCRAASHQGERSKRSRGEVHQASYTTWTFPDKLFQDQWQTYVNKGAACFLQVVHV